MYFDRLAVKCRNRCQPLNEQTCQICRFFHKTPWWSAPAHGLEDRLHDQIDPSLMNYFYATFSSADAQDYAIRALLNNEQGGALGNAGDVISGGGGSSSTTGSVAGSLAGYLGAILGGIPAEGMKDALAHAMPMVQYLLMMALVIALPFLLVFSGYSFKLAGIVTFSYFGLTSLTFWFQLAHWLENHLVGMLYSSQTSQLSFVAGLTSSYDANILRIVQVSMLLIFPTFWMAMLGWAGAVVGSGLGGAIKGGTGDSAAAGKRGGDATTKVVTKGK